QRIHFAMKYGAAALHALVVSASDNAALMHQDRAYGNSTLFQPKARLVDCRLHEVIHAVSFFVSPIYTAGLHHPINFASAYCNFHMSSTRTRHLSETQNHRLSQGAWLRVSVVLAILATVAGCATVPPENPENICEIFREKSGWHKAAERTQKKWGVPPQVTLSVVYQESSFRHDAQPPRRYILWVIPWGRVSSAYGYAQAKDETWD